MEPLRSRDLRRVPSFLEGMLAERRHDGLVEYVVRNLPALVPGDNVVYNEADVRRRRVEWREEPAVTWRLPGAQDAFERHMREHPLIVHRAWDGRAVTISDFLTRPAFHDLGLYQDFFRPLGLEHQLSFGLPASPPTMRVVNVNRSRSDFRRCDRALLDLVRPHLAEAFRTVEALADFRHTVALLERGLGELGRGVVVLGPGDRIRAASARASAWLERWFGRPGRDTGRLPPALRDWMRGRAAVAHGPPPPRTPLVVVRGGARLVIRLVEEADRRLLLLEEQPSAPAPASLASRGLTPREAEVLRWASEGKTNREIGAILGVSPRTIGNHLAHIYQRLGVETRTAAARIALTGH